jgi:hypothetical protein
VGSDHTLAQFSLPLLSDYIEEIAEGLFNSLIKEKWDILHIGPIAGLYEHNESLRNALKQSFNGSHAVLEEEGGIQTYFELTDTWEEYLARLKKKERQLIKSNYRKIENERLTLTLERASSDNRDQKFDAFAEIHQQYWQGLGKAGHFGDWPNSLEFHREVARVQLKYNRLWLLEIRLSDDCFAYQYSYKFGEKYFEFLPARSLSQAHPHIDLGRILFVEQAKNAIGDGVHYIDSMPGRYEYKLRLGGELFPMSNMYVFPKKNNRFNESVCIQTISQTSESVLLQNLVLEDRSQTPAQAPSSQANMDSNECLFIASLRWNRQSVIFGKEKR